MKRVVGLALLGPLLIGCGGDSKPQRETPSDPHAAWQSSPDQVIQGIMHAYETRDDRLYASLLADDFRYFFKPQGADSTDILGWGKEEEVVATGNLFKTPDVEGLQYTLRAGDARPHDHAGWMVVPVSGGEMVVSVRNKEPMQVTLNRQEIVLRPREDTPQSEGWEVVEWYDFPAPDPEVTAGG